MGKNDHFDLGAVAAQACEELGGSDRYQLAREITSRIRPRDRDAALYQALLEYCRRFTRWQPSPARAQNKSSKVAGIRAAWPGLRATIITAAGEKPIGDCTRTDLIFHASLLEEQARRLQGEATLERKLAAALKASSVEYVRDLPETVLGMFFHEHRESQ